MLLLGLALGAVVLILVVVAQSADQARDDAAAATQQVGAAGPTITAQRRAPHRSLPLPSFAGKAAPNAEALAEKHAAYPAAPLPAVPAGNLVHVNTALKDMTVEIAPGVKYNTWAFDGHGALRPDRPCAREGQTVEMTLKNGGSIPHSIDFHAAASLRTSPSVMSPPATAHLPLQGGRSGVYMYHCGTKPVLAHIANGMYGAIVVSPEEGALPKVDNEYVLVASEWYRTGDGLSQPASLSMEKARDDAGLD